MFTADKRFSEIRLFVCCYCQSDFNSDVKNNITHDLWSRFVVCNICN